MPKHHRSSVKIIVLASILGGCATPIKHTEKPMTRYDKNTTSRVDETSTTMTVSVYHSRYQFIAEANSVIQEAKSAAMAIARERAAAQGRKIKPIDEQSVRVSTGRNGLSGITSCTLQLVAEFE